MRFQPSLCCWRLAVTCSNTRSGVTLLCKGRQLLKSASHGNVEVAPKEVQSEQQVRSANGMPCDFHTATVLFATECWAVLSWLCARPEGLMPLWNVAGAAVCQVCSAAQGGRVGASRSTQESTDF